MGVNSIRSSHNPPAPELLNMCDTMGLIVMDESFDMWRRKKTQNDYARFFDEWHERDLTDLILRDRNHPSILMWSIGNEVLEQWSSAEADTLTLEQANLILNAGHDASTLAKDGELSVQSLLTQHLAEIVKRYDTSRPITAGCNEPSPNNHLFKSGAIDLIGFNYHHQWVKDVPQTFAGKPFIFSESVSALQTRGFYMMPSDTVYKAPKEWWLPYTDPSYMCSAYDNMHASWSSTHEETWDVVKHNDFVGGPDSTISVNLLPTDSLHARVTSASSTSLVSPRIPIICIRVSGHRSLCCTSSPTGTGCLVTISTCGATIVVPMRWSSSSTARVRACAVRLIINQRVGNLDFAQSIM